MSFDLAKDLKVDMTKDTVSDFALAMAKQRIASICLALGWNSVGTFSMEVNSAVFIFVLIRKSS